MIQVEFYGIPRVRAGVAQTTARGRNVGEVLTDLANRFPEFRRDCLNDAAVQLRPEFALCVDGERFISHPDSQLVEGSTILVLSADVGG